MNTSETIGKLSIALLAAQKSITFALKDAVNPAYRSKYADLPAVIDAVKPALNDAGIVFLQMLAPSEPGTLAMSTRLLHSSGEWIESTATAPLQKNDPQGYGSAATYLRRYSLASAVGLYQEDDDGQAASGPAKTVSPAKEKVIRSAAQSAIALFNKGDEMGAYEEVVGVVDKFAVNAQGEYDWDLRNGTLLSFSTIFKDESALRASLKKHMQAEAAKGKANGIHAQA